MKMMPVTRSQAVWYGAIYGLLLSIIYYSSHSWLVGHDWARGDYNYCYFVPLVVLYLIWEKKNTWLKVPSVPSWVGLIVVLLGILLFWVGELAGEYFSMYISSWLVSVGLLWAHAGWKKLKIMAFPICVSLFLFPLPHFMNTKLTFNLRLLSSKLGVTMIQFLGMSAYREGNIIDLGFTQLQVVDACSGLRYLFPLVLLGLMMAYFYNAALWKRVIIILSTIPLSIITNSLRIVLTAVLYPVLGRAAADGFFHDFSGWAIFMISLSVLLAEVWILRRILPLPDEHFMREKVAVKTAREHSAPLEADNRAEKNANVFFKQPQFIVAASLLAVTIGIHSFIDFREKQPITRSFSKFPLLIGDWQGTHQFLGQEFIDVLEFTDYTVINYTKPNSPPVNIYVAYYESQRKGKSIHTPETCLPGSGWIFKEAGTLTIPLSGESSSSITVMRAIMEKGGSSQLVYYWFNQRGRILTNVYEIKIYNFWDALVRMRTDGALIRVITPIYSSEKIDDAEIRLQSFVKDIIPTLNEFIPAQGT